MRGVKKIKKVILLYSLGFMSLVWFTLVILVILQDPRHIFGISLNLNAVEYGECPIPVIPLDKYSIYLRH